MNIRKMFKYLLGTLYHGRGPNYEVEDNYRWLPLKRVDLKYKGENQWTLSYYRRMSVWHAWEYVGTSIETREKASQLKKIERLNTPYDEDFRFCLASVLAFIIIIATGVTVCLSI